MDASTSRLSAGMAILNALVDGLRINNEKLNEKCTNALYALGAGILPLLKDAVQDLSTCDPHRRRLLNL